MEDCGAQQHFQDSQRKCVSWQLFYLHCVSQLETHDSPVSNVMAQLRPHLLHKSKTAKVYYIIQLIYSFKNREQVCNTSKTLAVLSFQPWKGGREQRTEGESGIKVKLRTSKHTDSKFYLQNNTNQRTVKKIIKHDAFPYSDMDYVY